MAMAMAAVLDAFDRHGADPNVRDKLGRRAGDSLCGTIIGCGGGAGAGATSSSGGSTSTAPSASASENEPFLETRSLLAVARAQRLSTKSATRAPPPQCGATAPAATTTRIVRVQTSASSGSGVGVSSSAPGRGATASCTNNNNGGDGSSSGSSAGNGAGSEATQATMSFLPQHVTAPRDRPTTAGVGVPESGTLSHTAHVESSPMTIPVALPMGSPLRAAKLPPSAFVPPPAVTAPGTDPEVGEVRNRGCDCMLVEGPARP